MKYDKKHHSPATHPAGSSGRKQEHEHPHGKGKLVYTDQGQPRMSALHRHTDKHIKREAKKIARKNEGDEQDIYYELKSQVDSDKKKKEKRNAAPQKHCMGD